MKHLLALLLLCLLLTGCSSTEPPVTTTPTTLPAETTMAISYPVPSEAEMPLSDSDLDWGLTLTADKIRSTHCTLRYSQSGGNPTGQLQTGAYFCVEVFDRQWIPAANLHPDETIAWNSLAYLITMNDETELVEDWSFLHGPLMPGWYRIGKEITDFRNAGDSDTAMYYAYFEITE